MITVRDVYNYIDTFAPFSSQCEWDNSGLNVGDMSAQVKKIALCLDATAHTVNMAVNEGADLLVTHHPLIFSPTKSVCSDSAVYTAVKSGLNIICVHTPWDKACGGVNDVLADALKLQDSEVLHDSEGEDMLRVGNLSCPVSEKEFAVFVKDKVNAGVVRFNARNVPVRRVAVGGGSCSEFMSEAKKAGADALVTADVKHHSFLDANDEEITLFDAGHFNTENLSVSALAKLLGKKFSEVDVLCLGIKDPISYV